ncbi:MAG TPA: PQQ-binding-like beta-propeller repeat protein [Gemmataceae bacterium]|jgi:outer membrane protein assembly factor BamB
MSSDITLAPSSGEPQSAVSASPKTLRVWPALVVVGLYWSYDFVLRALEAEMFVRFLSMLASTALLSLFFIIWWLTNGRVGRGERWACLGVAVVCGVLSALLSSKVGMVAWLLTSLPWVVTIWTIWLLLARKASAQARQLGIVAALVLTWSSFLLIRFDGLRGDGEPVVHWRWTASAEDLYRAERERRQAEVPIVPPITSLTSQPGDWPGFRGSERDGVVRGLAIDADWKKSPPRLLWRQRVGPGWSSMAVVGDRLFTQEQRDSAEAVVCLDAATGREVWAHQDVARFSDDQAGPGPRATPTFADGRLYTFGASGILNCLDGVTGERQWYHDLVSEMGAKVPIWGFCSSPLIVQGLVVVFAESEGGKTLFAYDAQSGKLAWAADAGKAGYSSPHRMMLDGTEQVLFLSVSGLCGVDAASGTVLWQQDLPAGGLMRPLQPNPLGDGRILFASDKEGVALVGVKHEAENWTVSRQWAARTLKSTFNDFVVHEGSVYGFDGDIFCCVDAKTGQRRWKDGRYGHGQVLLLAEPSLLLVLSENGEVILLKANPQEHEELGRYQAIEGKTWNHPAIAQGRLYVRNGEEMACYQLAHP